MNDVYIIALMDKQSTMEVMPPISMQMTQFVKVRILTTLKQIMYAPFAHSFRLGVTCLKPRIM